MPEQQTRILISGANGFIGSHIAERAASAGWQVYAGMRKSSNPSKLSNISYIRFNLDMDNPEELRRSLQEACNQFGGFDYIVHSAGVTKPRNHAEFDKGNAYFTEQFARMAQETQASLKKFVFISSIAALGPGEPDSGRAINEDQQPRPFTPYGASKLKGERLLGEVEGLDYMIIRPSAVYGPRDEKFLDFIIPLFRKGFDFRLGPADQKLSFIHVHDLADAIISSCRTESTVRSLNISDGRSYGQEALNEAIKSALGVRCVVVRVPGRLLRFVGWASYKLMSLVGREVHLTHHKMREVTAMNWAIDISRAREVLEFSPQYELKTGIAQSLGLHSNKKAQDLHTESVVRS